ncbi:arsenate reductase (glutaredoxin) [[Haemophilus] ducreyi]|uniref:Arsenate reductase n=2 Tax=Haemophilus ducreyi TaxID=730 RepID=Q7VNC3_HAEDU|nr:arsenate reductase (glutaredoxin) [[Haemophilus] ducreyi]AAP95557.1 arsenate reductase, arsenical pump modifier protein [[Haemophilus] ducreyi 35000HP]AKO30636.1 arsenate reductase [[Haemophilus] ducreyi]AKO32073.1 arsenate reductase [[Haemophilus] ducreyi]AKO33529.1 arsenate reductase [[Haemophilus] ducreyi]AKO34975.1 arsenate reductase [[Haemophilus] ducreyi]
MSLTIYHNPKCSKSRATLAIIREAGIEPTIVEYLNTPLTVAEIKRLLMESELSPFDAIRKEVDVYQQYIANQTLTDDEIIELIATYPALLNRPFVSGPKGAKLCRPPELVKALL